MSQRARISLSGTDPAKVDSVCAQIKGISQRTGVDIRGPVPLPTKKLRVPCRKSPDGEGSETWDRWEMRIHKRLIDLDADERALRQLAHPQEAHRPGRRRACPQAAHEDPGSRWRQHRDRSPQRLKPLQSRRGKPLHITFLILCPISSFFVGISCVFQLRYVNICN